MGYRDVLAGRSLDRRIAVLFALIVFLVSGCGSSNPLNLGAGSGPAVPAVGGRVHGGQSPVTNANIQMWAVNANGSAASSILNNGVTVSTDPSGNFVLTNQYTCPSSTAQVFLTASGGNPGLSAGTNNAALAMMAVVGPCGSLNAGSYITINELTTVAAVWSLQQFMGVSYGTPFAETVGVTGTAQSLTGVTNAMTTAQNLVNTASGALVSAADETLESTKINTLANILSTCVNSDGNSACAALFTAVSPYGQAVAADTIQAALYMAQNPVNNLSGLYALQTANGPFQPSLTAAPFDWTLGILYNGDGLNLPYLIAADGNGNLWIDNAASSPSTSMVELAPSGLPVGGSPFLSGSGSPMSGPQTVAIDTLGNVWNAEHGSNSHSLVEYFPTSNTSVKLSANTGTDSACLPETMAIDGANDIFFACGDTAGQYLFEYPNTGTVAAPVYGSSAETWGAVGSTPYGMAIDPAGNVWVGNEGSNSVTELPAGNLSSPSTYTVASSPYGVAVDHSGNVWSADGGASEVTELVLSSGSYSAQSFPGAGLNSPRYLAVDGAGNIWVANSGSSTFNSTTYVSVSELSNTGAPVSPDANSSLSQPGGFAKATTATSPAPRGIAIDPSGNVWVTGCSGSSNCGNSSSFVLELVGAAAPVVTPLSAAVASNQLGCCGNTSPSPNGEANTAGSLMLAASSYSPTQNYGSFSFAVFRTGGTSGAVSVTYATSDGTATAPTDYTAQSGSLTWAAGDSSVKTIIVPWLDTLNYAGTKTFSVTLSNPTGGAELGYYNSTLVTVSDNLTPPHPTFSFASGNESYTLQLPLDIYGGTGGTNGSEFASASVTSAVLNSGYSSPYFYLNASNQMVFTAVANGATTSPGSGSNHTRSELREYYSGAGSVTGAGSTQDWSSVKGGTLNATVKVTQIASQSDEATIGQIHGDDPTFAVLEYRPGSSAVAVQIYATPNGTSSLTTLLSGVSLGDSITYGMVYLGNTLTITVTDNTTHSNATQAFNVSSWAGQAVYFKVGAYHDTTNTGNPPGDQTQVVVSSFSISHP
jgi:hypothetical protein